MTLSKNEVQVRNEVRVKKRSLSKKAKKRSSRKKGKSSKVKRNSSSRIIKGSGNFTINDIKYIKTKDRNKHVINIIDNKIRKEIKKAINKKKRNKYGN